MFLYRLFVWFRQMQCYYWRMKNFNLIFSKWNEFLPKQKWLFRAKTCFIKDSSNLGTESCLEEGDRRWGGRPGQTQDRVSKGRAKRQKKVQSDVDQVFWRRTGAGNGQKWLLSIWQQGEQGQQEKLVERKQNKAASFFGCFSASFAQDKFRCKFVISETKLWQT